MLKGRLGTHFSYDCEYKKITTAANVVSISIYPPPPTLEKTNNFLGGHEGAGGGGLRGGYGADNTLGSVLGILVPKL